MIGGLKSDINSEDDVNESATEQAQALDLKGHFLSFMRLFNQFDDLVGTHTLESFQDEPDNIAQLWELVRQLRFASEQVEAINEEAFKTDPDIENQGSALCFVHNQSQSVNTNSTDAEDGNDDIPRDILYGSSKPRKKRDSCIIC